MISILEVKKDSLVELRNGFFAKVLDNKVKAHTRMCTVEGIYVESGSVYATDILNVLVGSNWERVEHTPAQNAGRASRIAYGF